MTGPVWIEQLNSLHRVVARTRCSGDKLRIGRGYGNDLVLDDPRVAADHLVVHIAADGGVNVQAQGDCTLFVEGERAPCRVAAIDGDSILRIGHTRLRIRGASYPVPESLASEGARPRHLLIVGNLLLLVTLLLLALDQWRNNATGAPYWRQLPDTFILVFLVLLWAGGWALVSRLMGHRSRFAAHEFIAALAAVAQVKAQLVAIEGAKPKEATRPVLMAVATKGGGVINEHFGHASEFLIYEASSEGVRFIGHRKTVPYCEGGDTCGDGESALDRTLRELSGCEAVLCSKVGYEPWGPLEAAGITPNGEHAMEPIEGAVAAVYEEMRAAGKLVPRAETAAQKAA